MSAKKIPIGKIPIPPPDLIPDEDDFDVNEEDVVEDTPDDEDEYPDEDDVDEDYLGEDDDQTEEQSQDEQSQDEQRRRKEDAKKDETEKPKKEEEEPGKQRSEDPTPEANRDPRTEPQTKAPGEGSIPGEGVGAGEEAAGQAARTATGAAGRGAAVAGEGATTAAGGAAGAAGGAAAAGAGAAGAAATGAAATGAAAGGAAAATATAPAWGTCVIIIVVVIAIVIVGFMAYGALSKFWEHTDSGEPYGSSTNTPADVTDANLRTQIAELAVAAGDNELRKTLTKEKLENIFTKLTAGDAAAVDHASKDLLVAHITAARDAASRIIEPITTTGDNFTRQLQTFQYHMNMIAATLMGVSNNTPTTLVERANSTFNNTVTWVRTANSSDKNAPLRNGSNKEPPTGDGGTRGCDTTGYITYILRNPLVPCTDCFTPNFVDLPKYFASALVPVDISGGFKPELLQDGDIVLTTLKTTVNETAKTDYGAFFYLGGTNKEVAFCGPNGPTKQPSSILTAQNRTVTALLRLRAAP